MKRSGMAVVLMGVAAMAGAAMAGNATVPGEVTTPYPTITNLAAEWRIEGDDNLNARVTVKYREVGDPNKAHGIDNWHDAMDLRRVPAGESKTTTPIFKWDNKFSGSIFDLKPDTEYQIRLILKDPDGGEAEKEVRVRTRAVPKAAANAAVRKVDSGTINDVKPGEIGLLADGDYGDFVAKSDGEPGKPIVYRAAGKGAKFKSISLKDRKHVYVEGVVIRTQGRGAAVQMLGAENCVVRRCDIECVFGIRAAQKPGMKNCYVADNVIKGTTPWTNEAMGASGKNVGEGIEITGSGNVVCYNKVSNFRDCLSHMEDTYTAEQYCNDFLNNDLYVGADDGIEADFAMSNCRIMRNRLTNCFVGLSSQPGLGGPTYFIRNVMYNLTYAPFKLHRFSKGDVILHNTVVKGGDGMACFSASEFDFAFFRNNLCIGGPAGEKKWGKYGSGAGTAVTLQAVGAHSDLDFDALGTWKMPFKGKMGTQVFSSVEEMRKGPFEKNGRQVGMDVFKDVAFPEEPEKEYLAPDLRVREGSSAVDVGAVIPNVNDTFKGKGPDVGAYEAGQPLPVYGPRPEGVDESAKQ